MANCVPSRVDSATSFSFTASPSHAAAWGLVVLAGASMERGGEGLPDSLLHTPDPLKLKSSFLALVQVKQTLKKAGAPTLRQKSPHGASNATRVRVAVRA